MTARYELIPPTGRHTLESAFPLMWPDASNSGGFSTDIGWDLQALGTQDPYAVDLFRIAVTAYLADRMTPRGTATWSRELFIRVPVSDVSLWTGEAGEVLVDLLHWLSGDLWILDVVVHEPHTPLAMPLPGADKVVLLSGGLDSLCGAFVRPNRASPALFLAHRGTENVVRKAQNTIFDGVLKRQPGSGEARHGLAAEKSRERTSRTRSLLFMAMAIAASDAGEVFVPENGFTSVNLALRAARGGACSTRSTHPSTFLKINRVLEAARLSVRVNNPHAQQTKGQMVRNAARSSADFASIAGASISCSKLDGRNYRGGNPNSHCGLCVACIVRRAAFLASGVPDESDYLVDSLRGAARSALLTRRKLDVEAVKYAIHRIPSKDEIANRLVSAATWSNDQEIDNAARVYRAGLKEISLVPLA